MKKALLWLAVSAFIMMLLPWSAVTFVKGDNGMAVCLLLFFAVDPVYSVILGIVSGRDTKTLWFLPLVSACLFLAGTWIFFDIGETAFILYAAIYLVLGAAAMLITAFIKKKASR